MDFRFDSDESTIIAEARQIMRGYLPRERFFHGSTATGDWPSFAKAGWLHAILPAEHGGSDLPLHVVAGVAREAGSALAGEAFVNNAVLIPRLLAASDEPARLLADHLGSAGFLLSDGRSRSLLVTDRTSADWCFGVEHGFAPFAVRAEGLDRYEPGCFSFRPLGDVTCGIGAVDVGDSVAEHFALKINLAHLEAEGAVTSAAALVGLGETALTDACAYALERHQFGGPIGRFQAIKHELANVATELEIAWNAVLYAALRVADVDVGIARLQAARAAQRATRAMVQFFGGIGVTVEHHAHLYLKAAATSAIRFGAPDSHAEALGRELLRGAAGEP